MRNMSAADMFVPFGDEQSHLDSRESKYQQNGKLQKLLSGAILTASVMLATKLQAAENSDEESLLETATLSPDIANGFSEPTVGGNVLENLLGSVTNNDQIAVPIEIASYGNVKHYDSSASMDFISEKGLPSALITDSLGVEDPAQATQYFDPEPEYILDETANQPVGGVARGPAGADGEDGEDGLNGHNGTNGANGTDGTDGRDGTNGSNGANGRDGRDGKNGTDGNDGRDGTDGTNGSDGEDGRDGTNGTNGTDGADGRDGQTILMLDTELLNDSGLYEVLIDAGYQISEGPFGTSVLTIDPGQLDELVALFNQYTGGESEEGGETHGTSTYLGDDQDDYIVGSQGDNVLSGLGGNDTLIGGEGADILLGGDGSDTAGYETSAQGVSINLEDGTAQGGDAEGDTLVSIENLLGSQLSDTLIGNDKDNRLSGNDGIDSLFGGDGSDTISGGAGGDYIDGGASLDDTASYFESDAGVTVSLLSDEASGGHAEGDELDNIEYLDGSLFDDVLTGDNLNNRLGGHHGEDQLYGMGGNDILLGGNLGDYIDGGTGTDTADYTASLEGVSVNLLTGENRFGEAEGDVLVSIENLAGSEHNDTLTGDDSVNRLTGRDGDDTLIGNGGNDRFVGGQGADHMDGGEGTRDAADYSAATEAVGVDLESEGFKGEATGDTFNSVEFVVGSEHHDIIYGDSAINRLIGGDGCDILYGRDGNDTLIGGTGDDVLNGGAGNDVFIFDGARGYDIIEDFEAGAGRTDRVWLQDHEFEDFADVQSAMSQTEEGVLLTIDAESSVMLQGMTTANLVADDFILA